MQPKIVTIERQRESYAQLRYRQRLIEKGLCIRCAKEKVGKGKRHCEKCLEKGRTRSRDSDQFSAMLGQAYKHSLEVRQAVDTWAKRTVETGEIQVMRFQPSDTVTIENGLITLRKKARKYY